jgi:nucleoid-associated protein YgaU
MPNDAKLGLVVGVGLVIAVAVVFFRKESPAADPVAANVKQTPATATTFPGPAARSRPVAAHSGIRTAATPTPGEARCHTVREGDTLFNLAKYYYGDREKSDFLYQANRSQLSSPDALAPGTVLVIPDLPPQTEAPEAP